MKGTIHKEEVTVNIRKRVLSKLDRVYAVVSMEINGRTHFLAASEGHGQCLMFSPPNWETSVIWDGPGGCMSLVPIPGRQKALVAIQEFFPVFQSEHAGIVYAEVAKDITKPWKVSRILNLPFVHRIQVVKCNSTSYLVASSICGGKAFRDDWSRPGAVYAGRIPQDPSTMWFLKPILENISKNHGMHQTIIDGKPVVMISGKEGLFLLETPQKPHLPWGCQQLLTHEISDMYAYDLDDDEKPEIVTIEPFHGDRLIIYKHLSNKWLPVFETAVNFGHVVWAGEILGRPGVLGGSRGGSQELFLLYPKTRELTSMDRIVLDSNVETMQIAVIHRRNHDLILSANQALNEVALYELTM